MKFLKSACAFMLFGALSLALAHATLVFGTVSTVPAVPRAGQPFALLLDLQDPMQVPTEDAFVLAEFRSEREPSAEPISARLEESDTPGRYRAEFEVPHGGAWQLVLRDQTFRQEEATATLSLNVGAPTDPDSLAFIFPPTATGPKGLGTWLLWLIGIPVAAGIAVTVLVLRGGSEEQAQES